MIAVIQRVSQASVTIEGKIHGAIQQGLLVLLGIASGDQAAEVAWLSKKIVQMRIFNDSEGKMNQSLQEVEGDILLISQFTLHAMTKKRS
ncbi:MAG TPA: D-tyrosyl-tRNA(Tyr) deacylase, partial [Microscillaceae bacterium]|nr:D-tyrosyl-tRNA(Tyr) deacylase [Microscillaceae bacterium]